MSEDLHESALKELRKYRCSVLVTTDICARGIDIEDVDHIINFDLPDEPSAYAHRVGRIGSLKGGTVTSFYDPEIDNGLLEELIKFIRDADQEVPGWLLEYLANPNQANGVVENDFDEDDFD